MSTHSVKICGIHHRDRLNTSKRTSPSPSVARLAFFCSSPKLGRRRKQCFIDQNSWPLTVFFLISKPSKEFVVYLYHSYSLVLHVSVSHLFIHACLLFCYHSTSNFIFRIHDNLDCSILNGIFIRLVSRRSYWWLLFLSPFFLFFFKVQRVFRKMHMVRL